jgi:hypothetical protein
MKRKQKKIKVKNTLPHLLSALCTHDDCPEWLKLKIWDTLNDNADIPPDSPDQYTLMLKYSRLDKNTECDNYEVIQ